MRLSRVKVYHASRGTGILAMLCLFLQVNAGTLGADERAGLQVYNQGFSMLLTPLRHHSLPPVPTF